MTPEKMRAPTLAEVDALIARLDTIQPQRTSVAIADWVSEACDMLRRQQHPKFDRLRAASDRARGLSDSLPDLLQMLEEVTNTLQACCMIISDDKARGMALSMVADARKLIAKAKGQS